jgi:RNA polymerase sigma factor (sigma-70 family)
VLGVSCEWLWPDKVLEVVAPKVVAQIDVDQLRPMLVAAQVHPKVLTAAEQIEDKQFEQGIDRALVNAELNEREREVVRLLFGLDDGQHRTLQDTAELLGVCRERVRQIEQRALSKLRHPKVSTELRELLKGRLP